MLKSRHSLIAAILILYFIPIFVMGSYSLRWLTVDQSWSMISLSIMLATCGSIVIYGFLYLWEVEKTEPPTLAIVETQEPISTELQTAYGLQSQELKATQEEMARFQRLYEDLDNEKILFKESLEEQLEEKSKIVAENEQELNILRQNLESTLKKNEELEIKVNDLSYEIKTLLQLSSLDETFKEDPFETHSHPELQNHLKTEASEVLVPMKMIRNPEEASLQLKRCLDIAQKITGANHYQQMDSRYQGIQGNNIALDLRHLFDNLRSEHGASILFYSQKENKLLFANNQIKHLLGWSPEKIIQDFSELTLEGIDEWNKATQQLNPKTHDPISLMMKTKSGDVLEIKAIVGIIPSGVFRQDLIAILYPK